MPFSRSRSSLPVLKEGDVFLGHTDRFAGPGIPPNPGIPTLHRERPKAAKFHPLTIGKGGCDFIENSGNHAFDVPLVEMRVLFREALN